ncbi:MAG TPA: nitrous oxide-stimulated promoter family protein [Syntrophorhabdales bacterium]|nr:nitrous oxide-stimulated promoter family protein [Syntrophorhabdales bacterium]
MQEASDLRHKHAAPMPSDPKPMCKKCESQCYKGEYKARIREIMKFSGMRLVKRGRVDLLYHYFR